MILGFGNNIVSALAGDITTVQTEIPVMPGTGAKFAKLLSADFENKSNTQRVYAKITLTDNKESAFEICHLVSVSGDVLNVIRGQEGTMPKGWYLNDVVANFATRGSENHFVQIDQLQSGHYIAGVAGGTANALTLELPATFFVNGSTDWTLRTPIIVFPVQNNTNAVTLQLILGGKVLGTFPLYKGNKSELTANDIIKGIPLICLLDSEKMYFSVINPGNIYSDFDQRYVKKPGDTMTGDLNLPNLYASGIIKSGGEIQTISANAYRIIHGDYGVFWHQNGNDLYLMLTNRGDPYGAFNDLRPFVVNLTTGKVSITNGATIHGLRVESSIALGTDNALGANAIVLGDSDTGFKQNGDGILDAYSNGRQVMRITPNAVQVFSWTGSWISMRDQPCFTNHAPVITDGAEAIARQEHQDRHFILGGLGNHQFGIYMINKSRSVNGTDGQAFLDENGNWICGGQVVPGNYANFDARYATQAWVLQNFVQNIDLTAPTEFQFWDGRGYMRPTDGAAMYNFAMVGGSSNVGWIQIRYTRKLVNNTWYVIN